MGDRVCYIYKLCYKNYYYIGSTIDIPKRMNKHKSRCFNENDKGYNYKVYTKFRELGININNFNNLIKIILDECYEYENKKELENVYIDIEDKYCLNVKKENQNRYNEDGTLNKEYDRNYHNNKKNKKTKIIEI